MSITTQLDHLIKLGVADLAEISVDELRAHADRLPDEPGAILAIHPDLVPASRLSSLLTHRDKRGFVVTDLTDLDDFAPIAGVEIPQAPVYLLLDVERGDEMRNWSPVEALPAITARGRSPLTVTEGISWLLQAPKMLEPNHCFMTIASRKLRSNSELDARTPAIWISSGAGRDGSTNRHAPKVGWCWAGNRHTWLGFASARGRTARRPD